MVRWRSRHICFPLSPNTAHTGWGTVSHPHRARNWQRRIRPQLSKTEKWAAECEPALATAGHTSQCALSRRPPSLHPARRVASGVRAGAQRHTLAESRLSSPLPRAARAANPARVCQASQPHSHLGVTLHVTDCVVPRWLARYELE